jgi:hypothetical protein
MAPTVPTLVPAIASADISDSPATVRETLLIGTSTAAIVSGRRLGIRD